MKKTYGLLGEKLSHSLSPQLHSYFGDYDYRLFPVEKNNLDGFMRAKSFDGINVTIPYKAAVIPYLDEVSDAAREMNAVNTIIKRADGSLYGDNTDAFGLNFLISATDVKNKGKALILGSGGAAGAARYVLEKRELDVINITRGDPVNNYENHEIYKDSKLIINCTPVGMYPNNGDSLVPVDLIPCDSTVIDMIYNPIKTSFLLNAEERGAVAAGGLLMLVAQGAQASSLFCGTKLSDEMINSAFIKLLRSRQNIILVGMPGSGKSTVGKLLAQELSREFTDTDQKILKEFGRSPEEIIKNDGEAAFRAIESQIVAKLGREGGKIIATGGGSLTKNENIRELKQNGVIIYIKRPNESLERQGRPLSVDIDELYKKRSPIYEAASDFSADNGTSPELCVNEILMKLDKYYENTRY